MIEWLRSWHRRRWFRRSLSLARHRRWLARLRRIRDDLETEYVKAPSYREGRVIMGELMRLNLTLRRFGSE